MDILGQYLETAAIGIVGAIVAVGLYLISYWKEKSAQAEADAREEKFKNQVLGVRHEVENSTLDDLVRKSNDRYKGDGGSRN